MRTPCCVALLVPNDGPSSPKPSPKFVSTAPASPAGVGMVVPSGST
jgi:hypothetical protein